MPDECKGDSGDVMVGPLNDEVDAIGAEFGLEPGELREMISRAVFGEGEYSDKDSQD